MRAEHTIAFSRREAAMLISNFDLLLNEIKSNKLKMKGKIKLKMGLKCTIKTEVMQINAV